MENSSLMSGEKEKVRTQSREKKQSTRKVIKQNGFKQVGQLQSEKKGMQDIPEIQCIEDRNEQ